MINNSDLHQVPAILQNNMMVGSPLQQPPAGLPQEEDEVSLSTYLGILYDSRWMIAKIVLVFAVLGAVYSFIVKPVYEATMLIHVEEENPNKQSKNMLGEISSMIDTKAAAISEMELLTSRLVISKAVENLRLHIQAQPKYFPVIGSWLAHRNDYLSKPGILGFGGYAWGAEKIDVPVFTVPDALKNTEFTITAEKDGGFRLSDNEGVISFSSKVGRNVEADTPLGKLYLRIDQIDAHPGAQFTLRNISELSAIESLQKSLTVAEKNKQSGIIGVTLAGNDPIFVTSILNQIGQEYVKQNVARKLEEAEKSLAFLDQKLPVLKQQLQQSEGEYNKFRNEHGTVDVAEEAKLSLQQSAAAKTKRMELLQKRAELMTTFTAEHSLVKGIDKQLGQVNSEINQIAGHIKKLPMIEQEMLRLGRDVKVNTDLYAGLLNTAQQLKLIKAGKVSNVRLVDAPMVPTSPSWPNRPKIIVFAIIAGLSIGVVAAFVRKSLNGKIDDPQRIETMLGSRVVYATIPHSEAQEKLYKQIGPKSPAVPVLAHVAPHDVAVESLRSFRTALQFSMSGFRNNIVMITGATAGLGKSFVNVNFAAVMAAAGKRVLLIDADFRNGNLQQYFGVRRQGGLSEVICGDLTPAQAIHRGVAGNFDFLSTGSLPPTPSELLLHVNFGDMLENVSKEYDLVLIDTAPVLPVSDAQIIGTHAGAVFILTRAGVNTEAEINETIKRLNQSGISPKGILFNDLQMRPGRYGYGYGKYHQLQRA